jgi:hypothetical protein
LKVRNSNYLEKRKERSIGEVFAVFQVSKIPKKELEIEILIMYLACVLANNKEPFIREN